MIEKILLAAVIFFFLFAFSIRSIKTALSVKKSIRGKSLKLTASIILSSLIYLFIIIRLIISKPLLFGEADLSGLPLIKILGYILIAKGFILGVLALNAMRNSWRVGIRYDQKTDLVKKGIYRFSRNPYFLAYDILFSGYLLIFPSPVLLILLVSFALVMHFMILEEENYLTSVHGKDYEEYRKKVNRYITFLPASGTLHPEN